MSKKDDAAAAAPKKSRTKLVVTAAVVVVVAGGAKVALPKLSKPAAAATAKTSAAPAKPGAVLKEDSITLNLADGHYLRVGLALQLPAGVAENSVDGSKALNTAIAMLSGKTVASLTGARRTAAVDHLDQAIVAAYGPANVTGVYLTDFVMQ